MTRDEFIKWRTEHVRRFPGLHSWLGKMGREAGLPPSSISDAWFEDHFRFWPLEFCLKASRIMAQDEERQPFYDKTPLTVRRIIKDLGWVPAAHGTPSCELCLAGMVHVYVYRGWLWDLIVRRYGEEWVGSMTCWVACGCSAGDRQLENSLKPRSDGKPGRALDRFEGLTMTPVAAEPWRERRMTRDEWDSRQEASYDDLRAALGNIGKE